MARCLGSHHRPSEWTPELDIIQRPQAGRCGTITSAGASALSGGLGRNQGPTKLDLCRIDNSVLADGLRGNSRLKVFRAVMSNSPENSNREFLELSDAVRENKGLVDLDLGHAHHTSNEMWGAICDSLKTHPTLEVLDLRGAHAVAPSVPAVLKSRVQTLVDMMKVNMSIHTLKLDVHYYEQQLFEDLVIPYLETNRLRPRLLAIQQTLSHAYRAKVLGRALLAVRTDPNRFWMLLSGNAEVAFPSTTATTTTAAILPTPANAAATENAAPVVATAASSVGGSATDQKRKACP